jgi:hypothetical protein
MVCALRERDQLGQYLVMLMATNCSSESPEGECFEWGQAHTRSNRIRTRRGHCCNPIAETHGIESAGASIACIQIAGLASELADWSDPDNMAGSGAIRPVAEEMSAGSTDAPRRRTMLPVDAPCLNWPLTAASLVAAATVASPSPSFQENSSLPGDSARRRSG